MLPSRLVSSTDDNAILVWHGVECNIGGHLECHGDAVCCEIFRSWWRNLGFHMCIPALSGERRLVDDEECLPGTTPDALNPSNSQCFHDHPLQLCQVVGSRKDDLLGALNGGTFTTHFLASPCFLTLYAPMIFLTSSNSMPWRNSAVWSLSISARVLLESIMGTRLPKGRLSDTVVCLFRQPESPMWNQHDARLVDLLVLPSSIIWGLSSRLGQTGPVWDKPR